MTPEIFERVYEIVAKVPRGQVVTYGQIARHLGMPRGARTVGWAMRKCPARLPWHRVVNARGGISKHGPSPGVPLQRVLLEDEGVTFDASGHVDLKVACWDGI